MFQTGHETVGVEMTIERKMDSPGDLHPHIWIQNGGLFCVENSGRNA